MELLHKITKANDVEGRSTDLGKKRRKTQNCGSVAKQKENGQNIGNAMRRHRICKTSHGGMRN